jgi:glycosyltransferase involved in cell wall biosynthesis
MRAALVPVGSGGFGVGLGRYLAVVAGHLRERGWDVSVLSRRAPDIAAVEERFGVPLGGVQHRCPPGPVGGHGATLAFTAATRGLDLLWVQSSHIPAFSLAKRSVLLTEFPFETPPRARLWRRRLRSYDVVANSEFTRGWIRRYWDVDARVIPPPVGEIEPGGKRPWILAVGRFNSGARDKRQLDMVQVFRRLCDGGLRGWELHLAGVVEDRPCFERVRTEAEGYPVTLHGDVSYERLSCLYAGSSIFWHAAGLGVDPEREPHRLEHFGIVTAEAMTAGCVPVAIALGGQPEIVEEGESGFLWRTLDELGERTLELVRDEALRERLGRRAEASARRRFGSEAFARRLDELLEGM